MTEKQSKKLSEAYDFFLGLEYLLYQYDDIKLYKKDKEALADPVRALYLAINDAQFHTRKQMVDPKNKNG